MDAYTGEIRMFAGNYAPENWAFCNGQTIQIQQNSTLYSILGTLYGGNGTTNFQLPNLQGQAAMGAGAGIGLTPRDVGETSNENSYAVPQFPHTHTLNGTSAAPTATTPANGLLATPVRGGAPRYTTDTTPTNYVPLAFASIGFTGGGAPASNIQPSLAVNFIICLYGNYPVRPQ